MLLCSVCLFKDAKGTEFVVGWVWDNRKIKSLKKSAIKALRLLSTKNIRQWLAAVLSKPATYWGLLTTKPGIWPAYPGETTVSDNVVARSLSLNRQET